MSVFLDNAQRILDVAVSVDADRYEEFALVIRSDGGLHFIMESPVSLDGACAYAGADTAYRVTRSRNGVRVEGQNLAQRCTIEQRNFRADLFRDQPLYLTASPVA